MYFANLWGLLGLLSLPIIAAIHLYQRRFPPLLVAGAHLWGAETRVQTAGRRRDRLPVTPSLLLELLAGLIFALALAQPRFGELGSVHHLVSVLDNSASMSGQPANGPSFREAALLVIAQRMETLGREARVTLIRSGTQPTLLGQQAMSWEEARIALDDWQPQSPRHDFAAAWDEAARIVGPEGRFLFLTDKIDAKSQTLPLGMDIVSVGRKLANVAISTARWTFDSNTGDGRLFVRLNNFSPVETTVTLTAMAGEEQILRQIMSIEAESQAPFEFTLPGGIGQLTLQVTAPGDGLSVDNRVTLIEPKARLLNVAVTLPADSAELRLAKRVLNATPDIQLVTSEEADLIVGPAGQPPTARPDLWWLGIGPITSSPVIRKQAKDLLGPYLIEKQHPLMEGLVLGGVVWGGVQPTDIALRPLISAGRIVLLGQLVDVPMTAYLMNIDLARSNLGESPDWPILLTNVIERRRDALPGLRLWNYRVGETVTFRVLSVDRRPSPVEDEGVGESADDSDVADDGPSETTTGRRRRTANNNQTLTLRHSSGRDRPLIRDAGDLVEVTRLVEPGVYTIMDGTLPVDSFAVSFSDPVESASLTRLAPGRRTAPAESSPTRLSIDDPYSWLMVLAILLLIGTLLSDWFVLRPRGDVIR